MIRAADLFCGERRSTATRGNSLLVPDSRIDPILGRSAGGRRKRSNSAGDEAVELPADLKTVPGMMS